MSRLESRRALTALRKELTALPPYATAFAASFVVCCVGELVLVPGPRSLQLLAALLGVVPIAGAALGAGLSLALALASLLSSASLRALVWLALAGSASLGLAATLGAFHRLGSEYDVIAKLTIAVCALGGLSLASLLFALTPSRGRPGGHLAALPAGVRAAITGLLAMLAALLLVADHLLYEDLYPEAHVALRIAGMGLFAVGLAVIADRLRLPALGARSAFVLLAAFIAVALRLTDESAAIQALTERPLSVTILRSERALLDFDRDGYSALLGGGDCAEGNAAIHPEATEIAGNGIDENCVFGDLQSNAAVHEEIAVPSTPSPMSVVLITIDSLRWDRLGSNDPKYGPKGRDTMPSLTKWARNGVSFRRAYSAGAWTSIALSTLMRGVYARRLTWTRYYETNRYRLLRAPLEKKVERGEKPDKMFPVSWHDGRLSLAQLLNRRGMHTAAVVDDGFTQMLAAHVGSAQGFDRYREVNADTRLRTEKKRRKRRSDAHTSHIARAELERASASGKPFFMWVHFFGPHSPTRSHRGLRVFGKSLEDRYDQEVLYADMQLAKLLKAIARLDTKVAVFVTADHGEKFSKTYRSHGSNLEEMTIRVPLVARVPGWKPAVIDSPVSLLDLFPTILKLTHTPGPSKIDGVDLSRTVQGKADKRRTLLTETWQFDAKGRVRGAWVAAVDGKRKVVLNRMDRSFSEHQQRASSRSTGEPIADRGKDPLARAILRYVEETGGRLVLKD